VDISGPHVESKYGWRNLNRMNADRKQSKLEVGMKVARKVYAIESNASKKVEDKWVYKTDRPWVIEELLKEGNSAKIASVGSSKELQNSVVPVYQLRRYPECRCFKMRRLRV
jgi:hypothetical protein